MKKWLRTALSCVCSAAMVCALAGCGSTASDSTDEEATVENVTLRMVTGGESGTYYAYGTVLAQYATNNAEGVTINATSSEGSKANCDSLENGDAELAFAQSDVASYAYAGTSLFETAYSSFSVVAALYQEQIQIVTCDPTIETVADLAGKTVSIGAANSGVYFNALDILDAYGMTEDDIDAVYQDFADSADSLKNGKIDACFIVAGAPTTAITDLSTSKQAYLVAIDEEHAAALCASSPYYAQATIAAGTYDGIDEDISTVAILAVILAADTVSETAIYNFVASIFEGAEAQADAHAKYAELDLATAASITSIPYHAGAATYFAEQGITVATK